jgi:hypothetical protein
MAARRFHRHRRHQGCQMTQQSWRALISSLEIYSVYRDLKYYSNVEYTQHQPHEKNDFFVRSVLFFATARIFFATARKKLTRQIEVESHTSQMPSRKVCGWWACGRKTGPWIQSIIVAAAADGPPRQPAGIYGFSGGKKNISDETSHA